MKIRLIRLCCLLIAILFILSDNRSAFSWPSVHPTGVTIYKPEKVYPGYNIFVTFTGKKQIKLIDMQGNFVHTWSTGPFNAYLVKPLPNANIMWLTYSFFGDNDDCLFVSDWEGNILREYNNQEYQTHHDFQLLDNDNILLLARKRLVMPAINPLPLTYDFLLEVNPQNEIVWSWDSTAYFSDFDFSEESKQYIYDYTWESERPWTDGYLDFYHTNSVQVLPSNKNDSDPRFKKGNILMSQRHTNIVFIIDKDTKDIVWKIGPEDNLTIGQHDAQMIRRGVPGAGNILIFDNGSDGGYPKKARIYSRIIEIDPLTKEIVWQYNGDGDLTTVFNFFSPRISGAQRLPNGNTLICEGLYGRFFEVTQQGEIVWEFVVSNPPTLVYRVYRVGLEWPPIVLAK